jgi:hypothetical protein
VAGINWSDVSGFASEFASPATPDIAQSIILQMVNDGRGLSVANYGGESSPKLRDARVLLACHLETMRRRRGLGGAISSASEGGASVSFFQQFINPRSWDTTSYGQLLKMMTAGTPARAGFIA